MVLVMFKQQFQIPNEKRNLSITYMFIYIYMCVYIYKIHVLFSIVEEGKNSEESVRFLISAENTSGSIWKYFMQ